MKDLPPFYVGQEVVCINSSNAFPGHGPVPIKESNKYSVNSIKRCGCGDWKVDVGFVTPIGTVCSCRMTTLAGVWWFRASRFAPIREDFQEMSFEKVIEKEKSLICVN